MENFDLPSHLKDAVAGADNASDKQSIASKASWNQLVEKARQSNDMSIEDVETIDKVANNPHATDKAIQETVDNGVPSSKATMVMMGIASILPTILGGVFEGGNGAIAAAEGSLQGASTGIDLATKLQQYDINERRMKEEANPLAKQMMVDVTTGKPVLMNKDGSYRSLAGKPVNAENVGLLDTYRQSQLNARADKSLEAQQQRQDYSRQVTEQRLQMQAKGIQAKQQHEANITERFGKKQQEAQFAEERGIVKNINTDSVVKKASEMSSAADNILKLVDLSSKNPIAAAAIPTFMARASGEVGNLSEADKRPFGGSQALSARVKQAYEQARSGTLTPENQKFVRELAGTFKKSAEERRGNRIKELSGQYAGPDVTAAQIQEKFAPAAKPQESDMAAKIRRRDELRAKAGRK